MSLVAAESFEPFAQPLNNDVLFLKETDIILTNDAWCIAIDIYISMYEEVIFTIRTDLLVVEQHKKEFASISELRQIETLLQLFESMHYDFHQILP